MQIENGLFDLHYLCRVGVPPESPNYFDLEDEGDQARLENGAKRLRCCGHTPGPGLYGLDTLQPVFILSM